MKNFNDIRKELKADDPSLYFRLEIMGTLMAERERKGISQRQLSKMTGVAHKTICRLENGLDSPKLDTISKISNALGMKVLVVKDSEQE